MIDKDLALLYGVETKRLNEQVKRNIERFPEDFMFQLTMEECLRSQIATLNQAQGQHLKYLPYALQLQCLQSTTQKNAQDGYCYLGGAVSVEAELSDLF